MTTVVANGREQKTLLVDQELETVTCTGIRDVRRTDSGGRLSAIRGGIFFYGALVATYVRMYLTVRSRFMAPISGHGFQKIFRCALRDIFFLLQPQYLKIPTSAPVA